jgi:hypothetical protein
MAISYLVKIGNTQLPKIKGFKVQPNKLWVDANRNMAGNLISTYVGTFHKLIVDFSYTTKAEMSTLLNLLEESSFTVTWFDENTDSYKSGTFYAGDYEYSLFDKNKELYEPFTVHLIPFNKTTMTASTGSISA